jgi:two-component system KDP operon response regulator KdpE
LRFLCAVKYRLWVVRSLLGQTVLLISRQPELRRQLRVMVNRRGGLLLECRRAADTEELLSSQRPDLILLDSSGCDPTGVEEVHVIRAHSSQPLIALVAANDEQQKLAVLAAGADDCMVLPLGSGDMLARLRRAFERTERSEARTPPDAFRAGALEVDFRAREVRLRGKPIHVTPTEYKLLRVLLESAGKVVTRERLLREVWGPVAIQQVRRLRAHMTQLRRKFAHAPPSGCYLIAEAAVGYRLWLPA